MNSISVQLTFTPDLLITKYMSNLRMETRFLGQCTLLKEKILMSSHFTVLDSFSLDVLHNYVCALE